MRKFILLAAALVAMGVQAQDERRLLTMEEAVLGTGIGVQRMNFKWVGDRYYSELEYWEDGVKHTINPLKPDGKSGAFVVVDVMDGYEIQAINGNLYYSTLDDKHHPITRFTEPGIVCGQTVSRNEFGIEKGWFWAPNQKRLAFYKKDESRVTLFPLLDITSRTGTLKQIRYPMNGMASEYVEVGVYDFASDETVWLDVTDFDDERYLTNVTWGPGSDRIYIQVLDRAQKNMHLNEYNAYTGEFLRTILTDHDDRYVEPMYPLHFVDNDRFIYQTNVRDGYWNMYLVDLKSGKTKRLVNTDADLELIDVMDGYVYYYSFEVSPAERHLFRASLKNGKAQRLTSARGWHTVSLAYDCKSFIDEYSSLNVPRIMNLVRNDGKLIKEMFKADDPTKDLNYSPIELGTVKSADGKYDNHYRLIKPIDFDPGKKYPVILYVYGGPHSQMVNDSFQANLRRWEMYMAQRGYVVFVMDNRGTQHHGAEYEKAIHKYCGQAEMADQMEGMKWLMSHDWVDKDRIGVHGWSYGGFMTISLMVNYPEVFKVGVAGGPVIDWKWYEVMYGERYMETEDTNPEGFEKTSLIPRAKDLKGKLLICQGAIDNTVVWEHSLSFVEACIKAGVQLDYFPYPTHEHNVSGRDRVHLMQKVTDYFEDYLK